MRRKGVAEGGDPDAVGEALELVKLTGYERRRPNQLSGGQQQRVALARALVNRPNVLLLDEPLGALDLKLRRQLQLELKRIQAEVGITFVYVTHDQEEALTMSDRIAVMNARPDRAAGHARGSLRRPRDALRGGLHRDDQSAQRDGRRPRGRCATVRLAHGELTGTTMNGLAAGQPVELCVRPEEITLRPGSAEGADRRPGRTSGISRNHRPVPGAHGRR